MSRFNPLFQQNTKRNVEVVRPQIIQNTIKQTNDNVVIDQLINDKILIGSDDKIISSSYSIKDIIQETKNLIPEPLQSGSNILIKDNIISSVQYDDSILKRTIEENDKNLKYLISNVSQETINIKNLIIVNSDNLSNSLKLVSEEVENIKKGGYDISEELKKTAHHYDKEIKKTNGEIDDIKQGNMIQSKIINNRIQDLEQHNIKKLEDLKTCYDNDKEDFLKSYDNLDKKINDIEETFKNKLEYNMVMVEQKLNNIIHLNNEKLNNVESKIDNKINNIAEYLTNKMMKEMEERDEKASTLKKIVDNLYTDVITLKDSNPQSKQLQKIIQQLTDKISLIDSHFKFSVKQ